jgi:hypothetical protein
VESEQADQKRQASREEVSGVQTVETGKTGWGWMERESRQ